jgi:osmotically-inducible protein OsmY
MEDHNHSRRDTYYTSYRNQPYNSQSHSRDHENAGYYDRHYNTGGRGGSYDNDRYGYSHENDYPGRYGSDARSSGHDYKRDFSQSTYGNRGMSYRGGSYEGGYGNKGYGGALRSRSSDNFNRGDYNDTLHRERLYSFGGSTPDNRPQQRDEENDRYTGFHDPYESATRVNEGHHRGKGPKGYRRSDERILEEVNDRLADDPYVDATEIEVTVQNGDVTLTGTIEDRHAKRRAEDIVESVSGVRNVENRLRVFQEEKNPDVYQTR